MEPTPAERELVRIRERDADARERYVAAYRVELVQLAAAILSNPQLVNRARLEAEPGGMDSIVRLAADLRERLAERARQDR